MLPSTLVIDVSTRLDVITVLKMLQWFKEADEILLMAPDGVVALIRMSLSERRVLLASHVNPTERYKSWNTVSAFALTSPDSDGIVTHFIGGVLDRLDL